MFDDETNHLLQSILTQLESDEYEYGGFFTVGGSAGNYAVKSPYNTECEYAIVSAFGSATWRIAIADNAPALIAPDITGGTQYGALGGGDNGNAIPALFIGGATSQGSMGGANIWNPLAQPCIVNAAIEVGASQSAYITVAFRRKLARYIPLPPRMPSAHRPVKSRRQERTFAQGFEAREQAGLKHG